MKLTFGAITLTQKATEEGWGRETASEAFTLHTFPSISFKKHFHLSSTLIYMRYVK